MLIVDDEPDNLKMLGETLLKQDYEVFVAASGSEALEVFATQQPDLVLLDVMMPGMDGFETCRQLRALPDSNPQIVFLTAMQDSYALLKGFEAGGADYITKPFDVPVLLARVRSHAALGRLNRDFRDALERRSQALRDANHRLMQLSRELAATEERERRQLAEDLHDGPIQDLALARIQLELAQVAEASDGPDGNNPGENPGENPGVLRQSSLAASAELLRDSLASLRTLLFELSPPAMTASGLASALQRLAAHVAERWPVVIRVDSNGDPLALSEGQLQALFRAARELLVNAAKHADTEQVAMQLLFETTRVRVIIEDPGKGFDPQTNKPGSYGLISVRERLAIFGGTLTIRSDHRGTWAEASLPLDEQQTSAAWPA